MKISTFKTNEQREQEGVWEDAGGGLRLKVARLGNLRYEEYLRQTGKPYARQMRHGTVDNKVLEDLIRQAMARHVLLDWENLDDEQGNPIPYSHEKALELLTKYRDFHQMVLEIAQDARLFKEQDLEEARGNSAAVSAGSSSGDSK